MNPVVIRHLQVTESQSMKNERIAYFSVCLSLIFLLVGCNREPEAKHVDNRAPQGDTVQMFAMSDGQEDSRVSGILFLRNDTLWRADNKGLNIRAVSAIGTSDTYFWIPKTRSVVVHATQGTRETITIASVDSAHEELVWEQNLPEEEPGSEVGFEFYFSISVSRDGNIIAFGGDFVSPPERGTVVYNATTKSTRTIACGDGVLSPDGATLAWVRDNNIYLTFLDDTSTHQLTHRERAGAVSPSVYRNLETIQGIVGWSRDGSTVLYYFGNEGHGADPHLTTLHIYGVNTRDGAVKQITHSGKREIDLFLDQSPTGQDVYYAVRNVSADSNSLRRVSIPSDTLFDITPSNVKDARMRSYEVRFLSHSPHLLAYGWFDKYGATNRPAVFVMDPDGGNSHKLIDDASSPRWMVSE
jgi:hypothetical protein